MTDAPLRTGVRRTETNNLLKSLHQADSEEEKQKLAWAVVLLNDAASTWLAKRFCPAHGEDDVSEARLALYDAAMYCRPEKGSSYLSVACWYYMRRTTGKRTGVGLHIPANTAQLMSRIKAWMARESEKRGGSPTLEDAIQHFELTLDAVELHIALWAVSNPKGDGAFVFEVPHGADGDDDGARFDWAAEEVAAESGYDLRKMERALRRLSPVEHAAVMTYTGECPPLRVVGEAHGISREWVNQTRKKALRALRGSLRVGDCFER
jgi:DNA-directed RNA polymerase specialized sigma subunit